MSGGFKEKLLPVSFFANERDRGQITVLTIKAQIIFDTLCVRTEMVTDATKSFFTFVFSHAQCSLSSEAKCLHC